MKALFSGEHQFMVDHMACFDRNGVKVLSFVDDAEDVTGTPLREVIAEGEREDLELVEAALEVADFNECFGGFIDVNDVGD
jgi:hypothetical protein